MLLQLFHCFFVLAFSSFIHGEGWLDDEASTRTMSDYYDNYDESGDYEEDLEEVMTWSKNWMRQKLVKEEVKREGIKFLVDPPKFMLDLYERSTSDQNNDHRMSDTVRSYINSGTESRTKRSPHPFGHSNVIVHTLKYNLTSLQRDEKIVKAELRLYVMVTLRRPNDTLVFPLSIYENTSLISYKKISINESGWEAFVITQGVNSWMGTGTFSRNIEVHIESPGDKIISSDRTSVDVVTSSEAENKPLLIVFSDEYRKKKANAREIQELIRHEIMTSKQHFKQYLVAMDMTTWNEKHGVNVISELEMYYRKVYGLEIHPSAASKTDDRADVSLVRRKRAKLTKSGQRRNSCQRRPMHVDFRSINWHKWIIAPKGYQAYTCTGRCFFPLSDHLSPTKHAILQTLLHMHSQPTITRACCVPSSLEPISILYIDEQGVVTFKYKYEGMVVSECGCR